MPLIYFDPPRRKGSSCSGLAVRPDIIPACNHRTKTDSGPPVHHPAPEDSRCPGHNPGFEPPRLFEDAPPVSSAKGDGDFILLNIVCHPSFKGRFPLPLAAAGTRFTLPDGADIPEIEPVLLQNFIRGDEQVKLVKRREGTFDP